MFSSFKNRMKGLSSIFSGGDLEKLLSELEIALLEADVGMGGTERIKSRLREEIEGKRVKDFDEAVREEIEGILRESENHFDFDDYVTKRERPVRILFLGINGGGKTTTIAKLGYRLKSMGLKCVFGCCDTFRAGAVEQLKKHGERLGIEVIAHQYKSDPASVAYDTIAHARARRLDVVLLDTAGRMQTNRNLIEEMKKIKRVSKPDLTIFVGDSLAGNDALEEAKEFEKSIGVDSVILTKIDSDAKGGSAIAIAQELRKPIIFLGNGEDHDKLIKFDAKWFVERLFGEGE
jgi:fused signal recognition particle receptor